jgi:RHS repeat-associated protein
LTARIASLAVSGGTVSASFVYDADGNRIKGTIGSVTTVYIAGVYEYQGGATTHYYEGHAFRRTGYASNNGVFYLLQDHLGSNRDLINEDGTRNGRNFYFPYGGNRAGVPFNPRSTKRFTGQYHEQGLPGAEGLSYYGARWYDAQLGRFVSADTIVPNPANPQDLNRKAPGDALALLRIGRGSSTIPPCGFSTSPAPASRTSCCRHRCASSTNRATL